MAHRSPAQRSELVKDLLARRLFAEGLGTAFLLATVVGSGVMGVKLAGGNVALALLGDTIPTGAILVVLILIFGPVSGAHFNPAVTLAFALRGDLPWRNVGPYVATQIIGAVLGVWAAHLMFELPLWQLSSKLRTGSGQWFAEFVATFGLLLTIFYASPARRPPRLTPPASTSRRPIGSPPPRLSPIQRLRSPVRYPTRLPASRQTASSPSSLRNSLEWPRLC